MRFRSAVILSAVALAAYAGGSSGSVPPQPARPPVAVESAAAESAVPSAVSFDDIHPRQAWLFSIGLGPQEATATGPGTVLPRPAKGAPLVRPVALTGSAGVMARAYQRAVQLAPPGCHLQPELLAAIGQVESGNAGGRVLDSHHRVVPAILGPVLDGGPFAAIPDTDSGRLDGNDVWDRAVGPMQFIPSTWAAVAVDGDNDGVRDPQDVYDAAASAGAYLCLHARDLARPADLRAAIWAYNQSSPYLSTVLDWLGYFTEHGLGVIGQVSFSVAPGGSARGTPVGTSGATGTPSLGQILAAGSLPTAAGGSPSTSATTSTTSSPPTTGTQTGSPTTSDASPTSTGASSATSPDVTTSASSGPTSTTSGPTSPTSGPTTTSSPTSTTPTRTHTPSPVTTTSSSRSPTSTASPTTSPSSSSASSTATATATCTTDTPTPSSSTAAEHSLTEQPTADPTTSTSPTSPTDSPATEPSACPSPTTTTAGAEGSSTSSGPDPEPTSTVTPAP